MVCAQLYIYTIANSLIFLIFINQQFEFQFQHGGLEVPMQF